MAQKIRFGKGRVIIRIFLTILLSLLRLVWYMSKGFVGLLVFLLFGSAVAYVGWTGYSYFFGANPDSPEGEYSFVLESGEDFSDISAQLVEAEVAQESFPTGARFYRVNTLYPGEYTLQVPATTKELVSQINAEAERLARSLPSGEAVTVTFKEGSTVYDMANILVEEGVLDSNEKFLELATTPGNFEYEFLPEPLECTYGDRFNCVYYYLEGYLYPDTYQFFTDTTEEEILTKLLDNFEQKVWNEVDARARTGDFDEIVTMASVIEKETGRSSVVAGESPDALEAERAGVASVLYNRTEQGITWSSDPTVNYGISNLVCQQTVELTDCVFLDDERVQTRYNTYANPGYPVGPITNPQIASVQAALNPANTDNLFFVADKQGVTRFAENYQQHLVNIQQTTERNASLE